MDTTELIDEKLKTMIKNDIDKAAGNEIFLVGDIAKESGKISDYKLKARGNKKMVPALINNVKPGQILIHNHPSGELSPSGADIRMASRLGEQGVGFAIINNTVEEIYTVVEPKQPEEEIELSKEEILQIFSEDGALAGFMDDYEYRREQIEVVEKVIDLFNKFQHGFIEAGTGTGKSFAYLIPALYWSDLNNEPVVVSTNTINLQEQLIDKDLVLLKKILSFDFKTVLVKGRGNYVCIRKLQRFKKRSSDLLKDKKEKQMEFSRILNWIEDTVSGTRSEANFVIDNELWNEISSEGDLCLGTNCPYFEDCFFMNARKEVYSADLLVVNHHLLMADAGLKNELGSEGGVLPKYDNLIIDEAHNIPNIATDHLGRSFYTNTLKKFIEYLNDNNYSALPTLRNEISNTEIRDKKELFKLIDNKLIPLVKRIADYSKTYYSDLKNFFENNSAQYQLRLKEGIMSTAGWQDLYESGDKLSGYLSNLNYHLNDLYERLFLRDGIEEKMKEGILELEAALVRLTKIQNNLDFNLRADETDYVFWLEKRGRGDRLTVDQKDAPLEIADLLEDVLWSRLNSLILTSATLTVDKDFSFFQKNLGLTKAETLQIESPFDYKNQAVLAIPGDIPPANADDFLEKIVDDLTEIIISYGGETMVLFTSYSMLNYCVENMEDRFKKSKIDLLPQGRYSRKYIINSFKKKSSQVIFGTVSFWEGIDIKGDDLKYLIMMKLPFPVPSEPVAAARKEKMKKRGENPFYNYSLPRAVIRFKQGFGRLIRSKKDKGMITVLDNRLLSRSYGKIFFNSLPAGCPIKKVKMRSLIRSSK